MQNNYIIKLNDNKIYCFYYLNTKGILLKIFDGFRWTKEEILISTALDNFTVSIDENGNIYLFCQDTLGDLSVCTNKDGVWSSKVILKNQASLIYKVSLNAILTENGMSLIYNIPSKEDTSNFLVFQNLDNAGVWSLANKIDRYRSTTNYLYDLQMTSYNHGLLFYQSYSSEKTLGYREITPNKIGNFFQFHKTGYNILETSYLTTNNAIHVLYIVKSMFSSSLIYKKKEGPEFSSPLIISEGSRINNCLMYFIKNKLYVTYTQNNSLYISYSEDNGNLFSKPIRYKQKFCTNPVKAKYISLEEQNENTCFLREVYVDKFSPWDIQIIPDLYEDFYRHEKLKIIIDEAKPLQTETKDQLNKNKDAQIEYMIAEFRKQKNEFEQLQNNYQDVNNKLSIENKHLNEKLNNILDDKNREIKTAEKKEDLITVEQNNEIPDKKIQNKKNKNSKQ